MPYNLSTYEPREQRRNSQGCIPKEFEQFSSIRQVTIPIPSTNRPNTEATTRKIFGFGKTRGVFDNQQLHLSTGGPVIGQHGARPSTIGNAHVRRGSVLSPKSFNFDQNQTHTKYDRSQTPSAN